MKSPILRQLAIAMTPDGLIGAGKDLLFTNAVDLSNFSLFTKHTVLIAGRNTAQQMINMGIKLSDTRPLIVISESGILTGKYRANEKFICYANSLTHALKMAESFQALNGYTVVGGATVYEEFLDMLDKGKTQVNRSYMFVAETGDKPVVDPVKLSRSSAQIRAVIVNRQVLPVSGVAICDVGLYARQSHGDAAKGEKVENVTDHVRGKKCTFDWITDGEEFDVNSAVYDNNDRLKLRLSTGVTSLRVSEISHWEERTGVNSVDIYMKNGQMIDARPTSVPGLNWLKLTLNKVV